MNRGYPLRTGYSTARTAAGPKRTTNRWPSTVFTAVHVKLRKANASARGRSTVADRTADQRCNNWPCALPSGHDGPCNSVYDRPSKQKTPYVCPECKIEAGFHELTCSRYMLAEFRAGPIHAHAHGECVIIEANHPESGDDAEVCLDMNEARALHQWLGRVLGAHETFDDSHAFKNFHRLLCERFGYCHDEKDWRRDQLSLIEHIATQVPDEALRAALLEASVGAQRLSEAAMVALSRAAEKTSSPLQQDIAAEFDE